MKKILLLFLPILVTKTLTAQQEWAQNARSELKLAKDDKTRFNLTGLVFNSYAWSYPDSAAPYAQQMMLLARKMRSDTALSMAFKSNAALAALTGNYPRALQYAFEELKAAERTKYFILIAGAYSSLSTLYIDLGDHKRAVFYAEKSKSLFEANFVPSMKMPLQSRDTLMSYVYCNVSLSNAYEDANQLDSALQCIQFVERAQQVFGVSWAFVPYRFGNIYSKMGDYTKAASYYRQGIDAATRNDSRKDLMENFFGIANTFNKINELDSSIFYANKVLEISKSAQYPILKMDALNLLAKLYKNTGNIESAAKYFEQALGARDSLFNRDRALQLQDMTFNEQLRQQDIQEEQRVRQYLYRLYALLVGLGVLGIIAFLLYRNNRQKQKGNLLLQQQKEKVESTLHELKVTQSQLIQSEKMASLGEVTAGIAHEIQNPLNFINNFSEVNTELIDELQSELKKENIAEAITVSNDLKDNEQKINHHGKRADAIVKGMLQHSRATTGKKELTDINTLADEYLRLSYHGLRAKDKSFNADFKANFDEHIEKIEVIPQDIGRVLLNLYNNAFYSVNEKKKNEDNTYKPLVSVSTRKVNHNIEVVIRDNGSGIPQKILDKIYQPFFTTKPTGQGTGLGLSLSYDIIKAHGGEIKVETKEGEGATFIIEIPGG